MMFVFFVKVRESATWWRWNYEESADTGSGRTFIWNVGMEVFKKEWLTGHGLESFNMLFYNAGNFEFPASHNIYLDMLVETGVVGLAIVLVASFFSLLRLQFNSEASDTLWLKAGIIAMMAQCYFLALLWNKEFWMMWTLVVVAGNLGNKIAKKPLEEPILNQERLSLDAA